LQEHAKVVLFQGGLSLNRNLEKLVESMAHVKNPFINLVILGDGPLKNLLQSITVKYNLSKKVHFHQAVTQEELLDYTSCADLGVIPYQQHV
jgi:glycosyltransferase involved in cell wall biosynthesis